MLLSVLKDISTTPQAIFVPYVLPAALSARARDWQRVNNVFPDGFTTEHPHAFRLALILKSTTRPQISAIIVLRIAFGVVLPPPTAQNVRLRQHSISKRIRQLN